MIEIECHKFKWGETFAGLYKITFDDKWIYIGSSLNLKSRFNRWRSVIRSGNHKFNIDIKNILQGTKKVKIEVLEIIPEKENLRYAEEILISKYWGSELLLNRCPKPTMKGATGLRPYKGYIKPKPTSKKKSSGVTEPSQPIGAFNKNGDLIHEFKSKGECCREIGTTIRAINKHLQVRMGALKGFLLKSKDANGNYITPPVFKRKKGFNCKVEKFYQINSSGEIVDEFFTMNEAAKKLKTVRSHVSEVLRKVAGQVTVRGHRLVYAKEFHS